MDPMIDHSKYFYMEVNSKLGEVAVDSRLPKIFYLLLDNTRQNYHIF